MSNKIRLDLTKNGNVGVIEINKVDKELALKCDKLASRLYLESDEYSGADYFEELANKYNLSWTLISC